MILFLLLLLLLLLYCRFCFSPSHHRPLAMMGRPQAVAPVVDYYYYDYYYDGAPPATDPNDGAVVGDADDRDVDVGVVVVVVLEEVLVMIELVVVVVSLVMMEFTEDVGDVDDTTKVVAGTRSPVLLASVASAVAWAAIDPISFISCTLVVTVLGVVITSAAVLLLITLGVPLAVKLTALPPLLSLRFFSGHTYPFG
uniref:Protein tweety homolog n=1 Tax=Anopheles maculatus TaxID=74869 RepID=A0A182SKR9_9DIPT